MQISGFVQFSFRNFYNADVWIVETTIFRMSIVQLSGLLKCSCSDSCAVHLSSFLYSRCDDEDGQSGSDGEEEKEEEKDAVDSLGQASPLLHGLEFSLFALVALQDAREGHQHVLVVVRVLPAAAAWRLLLLLLVLLVQMWMWMFVVAVLEDVAVSRICERRLLLLLLLRQARGERLVHVRHLLVDVAASPAQTARRWTGRHWRQRRLWRWRWRWRWRGRH